MHTVFVPPLQTVPLQMLNGMDKVTKLLSHIL